MRIAISGTHGTGKSTLIAAFAAQHPEFEVFGDPWELTGGAGPSSFIEQFHVTTRRLHRLGNGRDAVLERCPLDFLAYLSAWENLGRGDGDADLFEEAGAAMEGLDLLVLLPLSATSGIHLPADEDLELREEMDAVLLSLADDPDLVPDSLRTIEVTGTPAERLALLEQAL